MFQFVEISNQLIWHLCFLTCFDDIGERDRKRVQGIEEHLVLLKIQEKHLHRTFLIGFNFYGVSKYTYNKPFL